MKHIKQADLVLHHYGERLDSKQRHHLIHCPVCQTALDQIGTEIEPMTRWEVPKLPADYGKQVWKKLEPQLDAEPVPMKPFHPAPKWTWALAAAALVVLALLLSQRNTLAPYSIQNQEASQRILNDRLANHLERTTEVLADIKSPGETPSPVTEDAETVRWLLRDNRLYRRAASQNQTPAMAEVLEEVEFLLLQLSHPDPTTTLPDHLSEDVSVLLPKLRQLQSNLTKTPQPLATEHNF